MLPRSASSSSHRKPSDVFDVFGCDLEKFALTETAVYHDDPSYLVSQHSRVTIIKSLVDLTYLKSAHCRNMQFE
jgi:hypothetical protein